MPYDIRTEVIQIAGREALSWRVRASVFGPVITDVSIDDDDAPKSGHPLSLRWVPILFFFCFCIYIFTPRISYPHQGDLQIKGMFGSHKKNMFVL